jgi:hypothetical protein
MSIPRDHHFIPAFFLEQWASADGKLIEYSLKHQKLIAKPVGPRATGYQFDLYAFPELPADQSQFIEQKFFDYADRAASEALELVLANAPFSSWSVESRSAWSRFIVAIHFRHPDAMPELRSAAQSVWEGSGKKSQQAYELIKTSEDPATYDEYLAQRDPLAHAKARVNLIIKSFDNDILGRHLNNMFWEALDLTRANHKLLMSDRPVLFSSLKERTGYVSMPLNPTKLFVGVNDRKTLDVFRGTARNQIVRIANRYCVRRARKFVWANDLSQERFVNKNMSQDMEPTPLFPNIGWRG